MPTSNGMTVLVIGGGPSKVRAAGVWDEAHTTISANFSDMNADYLATVDHVALSRLHKMPIPPMQVRRIVTTVDAADCVPGDYHETIKLETDPPAVRQDEQGSIYWLPGLFDPGRYMRCGISGVFAVQVALNMLHAKRVIMAGFEGGPGYFLKQAMALCVIMRTVKGVTFDILGGSDG